VTFSPFEAKDREREKKKGRERERRESGRMFRDTTLNRGERELSLRL
jgi:hypothetical protein